jgi:hypothetical protein
MEKLVRIKEQGGLQSFQTQNGEAISKVAVVMTDGIDTFEAEAFDKVAIQLSQNPLNSNTIYNAQLQISMREWTNKEGVINRANSIRINKIASV